MTTFIIIISIACSFLVGGLLDNFVGNNGQSGQLTMVFYIIGFAIAYIPLYFLMIHNKED